MFKEEEEENGHSKFLSWTGITPESWGFCCYFKIYVIEEWKHIVLLFV